MLKVRKLLQFGRFIFSLRDLLAWYLPSTSLVVYRDAVFINWFFVHRYLLAQAGSVRGV